MTSVVHHFVEEVKAIMISSNSFSSKDITKKVIIESEVQTHRLNQIFNTALVASLAEEQTEAVHELQRLMAKPAFGAILKSIQDLGLSEGISEVDAAKDVINTFRRIDRLWAGYLLQEGAEALKSGH